MLIVHPVAASLRLTLRLPKQKMPSYNNLLILKLSEVSVYIIRSRYVPDMARRVPQ